MHVTSKGRKLMEDHQNLRLEGDMVAGKKKKDRKWGNREV